MDLKGNNFLVTGGAGFIGSNLVEMLLQHDVNKIVVFDNFIRGGKHNLEDFIDDDRLEIYELKGDITHKDELLKATKYMDGVFHLACLSLPKCQEAPRSAVEVNIVGTYNILEACVINNVKKIVFSSSSSIYGNAIYSPMDEKHPMEFRDFYAATKITGESLLRAFYYKHGLEYLTLRFMNIYGPRQDYLGAYVAIIIKIIDKIQKNSSPIIYGDGSQSFDFVFVEDACRSLLLAMESSITSEAYNISSGMQISILDLCKKIKRIMKNNIPIEFLKQENEKHLVTNRIGSTRKAKKELGFDAKVSLDEGLMKIINWKLNKSV